MSTSENGSKERSPFWRFMGLAVAIGAVALGADWLVHHTVRNFGNIKK